MLYVHHLIILVISKKSISDSEKYTHAQNTTLSISTHQGIRMDLV